MNALDTGPRADSPTNSNVLLFAGHRVDTTDRKTQRFPNTAQAEAEALRRIRRSVEEELTQISGQVLGIAGGACGGDILFHEVCETLGIKTRLLLALPTDEFSAESVAPAGPQWVARYRRLLERSPPLVLADKKDLPHWLASNRDYDIWQRNNLWILFNALAENANRTTLLALWDGTAGDGPGGTNDLIEQVRTRGHKFIPIDASDLAKLA